MKEKIGLFDDNREEVEMTPELLQEIADFNKKASERAITLECDIDNQLPLDASKIKNVAIVCSTHTESIFDDLDAMKAAFEKRGMNVTKPLLAFCEIVLCSTIVQRRKQFHKIYLPFSASASVSISLSTR